MSKVEPGTLLPDMTIENEECVMCFNNFDEPDGVNICLNCFICVCKEHAQNHLKERQHKYFLNRKRIKHEAKGDAKKLAIGVEGGFQNIDYTYEYKILVFEGDKLIDLENANEKVDQRYISLAEKVKLRPNVSETAAVESWEFQAIECEHVKSLKQNDGIASPAMKCSKCDKSENLWCCLTCGHVGCGRKNFDGSGGNNHAIEHYNETKHPVCVKLGTITPNGKADLYCYSCDEQVTDSDFVKHAAKIGIDVSTAVKTEQTTTELDVKLNQNWNFSMVTKDGQEFERFKGPNSVGLLNLGNSCYMASVIQLFTSLPPLVNEFTDPINANKSWVEPSFQLNRLYSELLRGKREFISPRILRSVVCRGKNQFLSREQQDACEFLLYLMDYIKVHNKQTFLANCEFDQVCEMKCDHCGASTSSPLKDQKILLLSSPCNTSETPLVVDLLQIIKDSFVSDVPERLCDKCSKYGSKRLTKFVNFPDFLYVVVQLDTVSPNGMLVKTNIDIKINPSGPLDLSSYKGVTQDSPVDENKVLELMNFGFSRAHSIRALQQFDNMERAIQWILDNPETVTPAMSQIMEMGFTEQQARDSLEETDGNVGLALEWLFNGGVKTAKAKKTDGDGIYELIGFISHKGRSAVCGHYVATIKRNDKWVLYNDEKVCVHPESDPPEFGRGYIYLYKRK